MSCRIALPLLLALLLPAPPAGAAEPLNVALAKAYLESPRLEAARADLRAVDEAVPEALSGYRPKITASTGVAIGQSESNIYSETLQTSRAALVLQQEVYSGGETGARVSRAEEQVRAERARLDAIEQEVLLDAVAAFTAVLRDQHILELALANEARHLTQLDGARQRFRRGSVTSTDVAQAEARHARAVADREQAAGDLEISGAEYVRIIGEPPGELLPAGLPPELPASLADALDMVDRTPLLRAARFDVAAAREAIEIALAGTRSRLVVEGEASYVDEPSGELGWRSDLSVGATYTVPIWQGGGEYARVRRSRELHGAQRHRQREALRIARQSITAAWQRMKTAQARMRAIERQEAAARIAVDGVREEALSGLRSVLDILDAEQELFEAQVAAARAARERILSAWQLVAATGGLGADRIGLDVEPYDPERHYDEVRDAWFGGGTDEPDDEDEFAGKDEAEKVTIR